MKFQHQELLESGKWFELSILQQMANIGSDVERTIAWKNKGDQEASRNAFNRSLELIYLTVEDPKNKKRLKEILRVKHFFIDYIMFDNEYQMTDESWHNYFHYFAYAAAYERREQRLAKLNV